MKRILAKFHANRSHVSWAGDCIKIDDEGSAACSEYRHLSISILFSCLRHSHVNFLTCRRAFSLKHGSDRHETLPKRVSDDPRQINFQRKKNFRRDFSVSEIIFGLFGLVLEALARNGPHHQLPRNFLL